MTTNPLHGLHEQAEATFLPYGSDFQIVDTYGEVEAEYAALRKAAALMDAPQRSVVVLTGKDRLAFLNGLVTNDVQKLTPGRGVYAFVLNTKGRIILDVNVLHTEEATLLETDSRLAPDLCRHLEKHLFAEDVKILDAGSQLGRLSLLGPQAVALLAVLTEAPADIEMLADPLRHIKTALAKITVTVFRNDLCGTPGYELIVPRTHLVYLWQILLEAGSEHSPDPVAALRAIGWAAFNTARIEAGTPLYGIDLTEHYLPMETGHWYSRAVSVTKGCYVGQEVVARMHAHHAVARLFVGLRVAGAKLPLAGTDIFEHTHPTNPVGMITSSCMSPMLGYVPVAMGFVKQACAAEGHVLEVLADTDRPQATVTPLPFWGRGTGGEKPVASSQ